MLNISVTRILESVLGPLVSVDLELRSSKTPSCSQCSHTTSLHMSMPTPATGSSKLTQRSRIASQMDGRRSNTVKCKTGNQTFPEMNKLKCWHPVSLLGTSCQLNHFPARCFSPGSKAWLRHGSSKAGVMNYSPCCLLLGCHKHCCLSANHK